jgi:hypothetical protein
MASSALAALACLMSFARRGGDSGGKPARKRK